MIDIINTEINSILAVIDSEEYPETFAYLAMLTADESEEMPSAYEIASTLSNCDPRTPMSNFVFDSIVKLYEAEIEDGNIDAINDLGALYYDGKGCNQDFSKAVYYYKEAAKQGSRQAQENLGYCYYYGRNMPVDYEKAFHYFALGAFDGHLISLYKIGDMYQNGYYVEKNPKEAFAIYSRCLDTMTEEAAKYVAGPVFLRVANAFLNGNGTDKDPKSALICYQKAELFLFDMVNNGDVMYEKSLQAAINGQTKARQMLSDDMPDKIWLDGKRN